jgi:hypothetical protein
VRLERLVREEVVELCQHVVVCTRIGAG